MTYKTRFACLLCSFMLVFMLLWLPGRSQYSFTDVDALLKQNAKAMNNNFAMLVYKDGKLIYQKQSADFTTKTQAPIASAANWLTAALVMTFVEEGKISLDDKINQYLPIFGTYMKSYITIRNCLTNTTGIHTEAGFSKIFEKSKYAALEDEVTDYAKREIQSNPGTEFYYSSLGPNIAARVLEVITKKSFDRLIQEKLLRPLKMRSTSFTNEEGGAIDPSGKAHTTAVDYINFLTMLLNKGVFEGKQILSEQSITEMEAMEFQDLPVKYVPKTTEGEHCALGTWVEDVDASGKSSAIGCNNMLGTYPFIDRCRNYAAILIVAKPEQEQKKAFYKQLKEAIDAQINSSCK